MIKICLFAGLKDQVGQAEVNVTEPVSTVAEALKWLTVQYPTVQPGKIMIAVNEQWATLETGVKSGDVIALLPPVSGG